MSGKLHEVLAVEGELEGVYKKILAEGSKTFERRALFHGFNKRYETFLDEAEHDVVPAEVQEVTETVPQKLDYLFEHIIRYVDCVAQKDAANQLAKANIEIDGNVVVADVPATTLLGLESKLKQIRAVLVGIPTLAPGRRWSVDEQQGKGIWRDESPEETIRTRKRKKFLTVAEATKEHAAQVKEDVEDQNIGRYIKETWSGCLTSARKSEILGNLDRLARAVKKARQRANCVEVPKVKIGKALADYILK
jgi:hypothetical protein